MLPAVEIERARASDLPYDQFVSGFVRRARPVVVEGAGASWPALEKWSLQFFKDRYGPKPVHITYEQQMPFDAFIDAANVSSPQKPGPYMYRLFICDVLPDLLPDLMPGNDYAFPRRLASPLMPSAWRRPDGYLKLLIGGPGGKFPFMHYDGENMHAAITEIFGDKEALLFAPEDGPNLYPRADRQNQSQIESLSNPDLERYPLLAQAQPFRSVLKPGETMFVPAGWWHSTRVLSPSVSVCANILDQSNWGGFVSEVCRAGRSPARLLAKRTMLTMLGMTLDRIEQIPERVARLAPTRAAFAEDLRTFKPKEYVGAPPY